MRLSGESGLRQANGLEPGDGPAVGLATRQGNLAPAENGAGGDVGFLARASAVLGCSLDVDETLQQLADLAVPRLADWCTIDVVEGAELRLAAAAHARPDRADLVWRLAGHYGYADPHGPGRVARTAQPQQVDEVTDELLAFLARDREHLALLHALQPSSAMVVPLVAEGRRLGAMTLVQAGSGQRARAGVGELAHELAQRAATAADHAIRYRERDRTARLLHHALLPPALPQPPELDVTATCEPVDNGDLGGDFYDLTATPDGWLVTLGDVCGKGLEAAGLAAQARNTVHTAALRHPDPRYVLGVLHDALVDDDPTKGFCTAVCAHLRTDTVPIQLQVVSGGHPPALIRRAAGELESLDGGGMLLGLFAQPSLTESVVSLDPDDLVLFYTDGVSDAPRAGDLFGSEGVATAMRTAPTPTADGLVDHLHAIVEAWQDTPRDDRTAVAVRVSP